MFTLIAIFLSLQTGWSVKKAQDQEDRRYPVSDDKEVARCVLHIRQDVRLVCLFVEKLIILMGMLIDAVIFRDQILTFIERALSDLKSLL